MFFDDFQSVQGMYLYQLYNICPSSCRNIDILREVNQVVKGLENGVQKLRWSEFTYWFHSGACLPTKFTKPIFLFYYFENIHSYVFLSVICHTRFFFGIHEYFLFIGFSEKSSTEIQSDLIALEFLMGIHKKASRTIFDS